MSKQLSLEIEEDYQRKLESAINLCDFLSRLSITKTWTVGEHDLATRCTERKYKHE